jgi:hypothetical protein
MLPVLGLLLVGCPKSEDASRPHYSGPPKAFKLLNETPEAETSTRVEKRTDLLVTVENGDPAPAVITVGQAGPLNRQGGSLRLYGDEAGKTGWSVDNFVLIEVLDKNNKVLHRGAAGFQAGLTHGAEQVDSLGQMKFSFGAGEIDISKLVPANENVTIKATALDTGGVGRVSNLYLILSAETAGVSDEEIR